MLNNTLWISDIYSAHWTALEKKIVNAEDSFIMDTSTDDLVRYYLPNNIFETIELDSDREEFTEWKSEMKQVPNEQKDRLSEYLDELVYECESIVIRIPILRNQEIVYLANLRTSTFSLSWTPTDWGLSPEQITLSIPIKGFGFNFTDNKKQVACLIEREKNNVSQWLIWVNNDIHDENMQLVQRLHDVLEQQKKKRISDKPKKNNQSKDQKHWK